MTPSHPLLRSSSLRRTAYAAGSLTVLLSLTGCAGSDDVPTATPPKSASSSLAPSTIPSATPSAPPSAEPSGTATSSTPAPTPPSSGPAPVSAEDFAELVDTALSAEQGADLTIDSGLGFLSGTGSIDFRESPASLAVTLTSSETGDDQQVVARVIGDVMYLQDGDRFLAIEVDSPSNPFGASLSNQLDPRKMLDEVEASFLSARERGTVERDGEQLSLYRASADGPALLDAVAPELADQPDTVVPDVVTCELSIGVDGRAHEVVIDLGAENGMLRYTLDDWRTDVTISRPPPGQVEDLTLPG
ncbi:MAG: hypothetical protein LH477_04770 [Nocardioides sp.]|nr:hypothetical protein [Nocardioides sp.]